ncbi:hypothetical protein G6F63_016535 [Rhizopus arrhizus]|nr:hypothetical protein G6F63_016535 [Rhizopus arrhizus]
MALEAASVAVKMPKRMPPMISTGTINAGRASLAAARSSPHENGWPPAQLCLRDCQMATPISDRPSARSAEMRSWNTTDDTTRPITGTHSIAMDVATGGIFCVMPSTTMKVSAVASGPV